MSEHKQQQRWEIFATYRQLSNWTSIRPHTHEVRFQSKLIKPFIKPNRLGYADDTTLMAENEEELKSLLMKVKEESEKLA